MRFKKIEYNLATNIVRPEIDPVTIITAITAAIPTIKIIIGFFKTKMISESITIRGVKYIYANMYDIKKGGFIAGYYSQDLAEWAAVTESAYPTQYKANKAFIKVL